MSKLNLTGKNNPNWKGGISKELGYKKRTLKKWRDRNKKQYKQTLKKYMKTSQFKESQKKYQKQYIKKGYQKLYLRKQRKAAIESLGGKCNRCGFSDERALQIDHINGDGAKERKERNFKGNFHKHVLESFLKQENKYQLLCANCNWIKRVENNEIKNQV